MVIEAFKTRRYGTTKPRASARIETLYIKQLAEVLVLYPKEWQMLIQHAKGFMCWTAGPMVMHTLNALEDAFKIYQPYHTKELAEIAEYLYWCECPMNRTSHRWGEDDGVRAGMALMAALFPHDMEALTGINYYFHMNETARLKIKREKDGTD